MYKQFNKEWRDWINLNIARGCDQNGIYKILIDEGFDPTEIERQKRLMLHFPLKHLYIEKEIDPFSNNWRNRYYKICLNICNILQNMFTHMYCITFFVYIFY